MQICPCLSVCARPSRFLTGSLRPLSGNSGQRGSLPRLGIDDLWVSAETEEDCLRTYKCLIELLLDLGFVVNRAKCVPPTTRLTFLGIESDSDAQSEDVCRMTITAAKKERGAKLCEEFLARVPETRGIHRVSPYLTSPWDAIRGFLVRCASVAFDGRVYMAHLHHAWPLARSRFMTPPAWLAVAMRADVSR